VPPQVNNKFSKVYKYLVIAYVNTSDGRTTKFWRPHSSISSRLLFCVSMSLNALKIVKYKIITAVLPQHVSPFPRNYREVCPHPHSVTVRSVPITTEYPRLLRYYRDPHPRAALYPLHTYLTLKEVAQHLHFTHTVKQVGWCRATVQFSYSRSCTGPACEAGLSTST